MGEASEKSNDKKWILFIGGNNDTHLMIQNVKRIGYSTIVVDKCPILESKIEADVTINKSVFDIKSITDLCKSLNVVGIFAAYSENTLYAAYHISKELNIPFYPSIEQIEICTDKIKTKNIMNESGLAVVTELTREKAIDEINNGSEIIIKPADSAASKGVFRCNNVEEIDYLTKMSLSFSPSKQIIYEKYMDPNVYDHIQLHYSFFDGNYKLAIMGDGISFTFDDNKTISTAYVYPSKHQGLYLDKEEFKVFNFFKQLKIVQGAMFIEGCVKCDSFTYWECGYRLGGSCITQITNHINNADQSLVLLDYSIHGKITSEKSFINEDPWIKNKIVCNLMLFCKSGTIVGFINKGAITNMPEILSFTELCYSGQVIENNNSCIGRIIIICKNHKEVPEIIKKIYKSLKLIDETGNNLLIESFDYSYYNKKYNL